MALSGSFILTRTSGTQYLQGRVEWSATQDAVGNTSTVRARLIFKRTNTGYTTYGTGTFNMTVNGTAFSTGSVSYSFGSSDVVMLDKTVTVPHNSDGSKSFTISADYSGNSPIGGNGSQSFALNTIDRNAPSISLSVGNISSNSFTLSATANYTCDTWQYSINNGSSWVTFSTSSSASVNTTVTGLSPATSYSVLVRGRRSHNHIYGSSPVKTVKTIGNAILNSVESLLVDSAAPVLRINITTYVAGYTHRLDICKGDTVITSISNIKTSAGTKNIDLTLSTSNRTALLNSMKTVKSFSATYKLYTYDGSSLIGSVSSKTGTVSTSAENSSPSFSASPAYTFRDSNTTTTGITGNDQLLIQGKSSLFVQTASAVAKNGASIARYTVTINKKSVSSTTTAISYGGVDISGNVTVTVTATDSRGYTVSASGVITVIPYSDIQITNLSLSRINNYEVNCVLNIAGRFSSITVGGSDKNSLQSLSYRKKQAASQTWSSWTELEPDVTSSGFSYTNSEFEDLSRDSAWDFEFKASDILSTNTVSIQVAEGTPTLSLRKNKVGINNHDPQAALDINGDIIWNGILMQLPPSQNLIINSDFSINQRGQTSYSTANSYTYDRWLLASVQSVTRQTNTCPDCSAQYMLNISVKNNSANSFCQPMENFSNRFVGKTVTVSLYVKAATNGTLLCGFGNSNIKTINATTSWQKVMFTIPSVTASPSSTWHLNGFYLQTPFGETSGAIGNYSITGVQVVYGDYAGQYIPPDPATELVKCQRFYQTNDNDTSQRALIPVNSSGFAYGFVAFPVTMRVVPNMSYTSPNDVTGLAGATNGIDVNKGSLTSNGSLGIRYKADAEIYS